MKLKKKLGIAFISISLLPYILGMAILLRNTTVNIKQSRIMIADKYTATLTAGIQELFSKLSGISLTASRFPAVQTQQWSAIKPAIDGILAQNPEISEIFMVDSSGSYWNSSVTGNPYQGYRITQNDGNPAAQPRLITESDPTFNMLVARNGSQSDMTVVSDVSLSATTGKKQFSVVSTTISGGSVSGYIGVSVGAEELAAIYLPLLTDFEDTFGVQAELFITSGENRLLTHYQYDEGSRQFTDNAMSDPKLLSCYSLDEAVQETFIRMDQENAQLGSFTYYEQPYWMIRNAVGDTQYTMYIAVPDSALFDTAYTIRNTVFIIGAVIAAVVLAASLLIGQQTAQPLVYAMKTMRDIAEGSGDLTMHLPIRGNNEIADVGRFFNTFVDSLHALIAQIKEEANTMDCISENLTDGTSAIREDINLITQNINKLHEQLETQSASTTEASSTIKEISENIEALSGQIETQSAEVTQSSAAIEQMVSNIAAISGNLNKASGLFMQLRDASLRGKDRISATQDIVGSVVAQSNNLIEMNEVIDAIAAQTNLLAMNAAIEAAHAGEAGAGFSVVADEIRKLAEDSTAQSKNIAAEITRIVSDIQAVLTATTEIDAAFENVVQEISSANNLVEQIAGAMQEQNTSSQSVLDTLKNIQHITEQIRSGSVEMTEGTEVVLNEMNRLTDIAVQVEEHSESITQAADGIGSAITQISLDTESSSHTAGVLNSLTAKFKL